jgi:hypothetical protein
MERANGARFPSADARLIVDQAMQGYEALNGHGADRSRMEATVSLCVAALGDHCALRDDSFNRMLAQVRGLSEKQKRRWKGKVDNGQGTNRRVEFAGGLLCVRNGETLVPVVPVSISAYVRSGGDEQEFLTCISAKEPPRSWEERNELRVALHALSLPDVVPLRAKRHVSASRKARAASAR